MKWLYRLLTIVMLCGALAVPFFINNQDGEPMLSLPESKDFIPSTIKPDPDLIPSISGTRTVYKWQDEQKVWHYGDSPPPNSSNISTLEVNSSTNVIQSIPISSAPSKTVHESEKPEAPPPNTDILSLDRAMNILNEAQDVKKLMEARNEQLNTITGDTLNQ